MLMTNVCVSQHKRTSGFLRVRGRHACTTRTQLQETQKGSLRSTQGTFELQEDCRRVLTVLSERQTVPAGIQGMADRSRVSPCSQSKSSSLDWTSMQSGDRPDRQAEKETDRCSVSLRETTDRIKEKLFLKAPALRLLTGFSDP